VGVEARLPAASDGAPRALLAAPLCGFDVAVLREHAQVERAARDRLARDLGAARRGDLALVVADREDAQAQRVGEGPDAGGVGGDDLAGGLPRAGRRAS